MASPSKTKLISIKKQVGILWKEMSLLEKKKYEDKAKKLKDEFMDEDFIEKIKEDQNETINETKEFQRCRKIEVLLNGEQKLCFQNWWNVYSWTYNRAIQIYQDDGYKKLIINRQTPNTNGDFSEIKGWGKLKTYVLDKERISKSNQKEKKMLDNSTPYDLKTEACHEAYARFGSTKESLKAQNKREKFEMKEKDPNCWIQSFKIPKNGGNPPLKWFTKKNEKSKKDEEYFSFWSKSEMGPIQIKKKREIKRLNEILPNQKCKQEITFKKEGSHYFIIVPFSKEKKSKVIDSDLKVMASDPGICTFQTTYDGKRFIEYAPGGEKSNDKEKPRGSIQRIFRLTKKNGQTSIQSGSKQKREI